MLRCFDGTFYVGVTNVGEFEGSREAIDFEKKLKTWSHKKKRAFAQKKWTDLKRFSFGTDRFENVSVPRLRSG